MKKIMAIIQARLGARRLPNKVLLDLEGKTVLERVVERVRNSKLIEDVVVATTIQKEDLKIVNLCSSKGIRVYTGAEDDVLDRYFQISKLLQISHIVRVTADCPLIDSKVIDEGIILHLSAKDDFTSNTIKPTFPDGEDVEVFTFEAITRAWKNARLSSEREHVTPYIRKHPELFRIGGFEYSRNLSVKRWTLDEKKDYEFIKLIYKNIYRKNKLFGMNEILDLLNKHPEYERINSKIHRNEGYLKSLKND